MDLINGFDRASPGFGSDSPTGLGPTQGGGGGGGGWGRYTLVVSEPTFRRFWKKALNDFLKGFSKWFLTYIAFAYKE